MATAEPLILPGATIPAFAVATPFPIVAVVGLFRPRLVIARSVLESCTPDELATIVAHEQAHVAHHDNLARALFLLAPDVVAWLPLGDTAARRLARCDRRGGRRRARAGGRVATASRWRRR